MQSILRWLAIPLSIAAMFAADKETRFVVRPAAEYPTHSTQEKVTVAAVPYVSEEDIKLAFGKMNPLKYGVLPVLVVIQNDTGKALRLNVQSEYVDPTGHHLEAIAPGDVQYVGSSPKRKDTNIGMGSPIPLPKKKGGPMSSWEIIGRGFTAKIVPAGEQVSGFFYFQTSMEPGSKFYLNGLREASSGKELFYFEVPLEK